MHAHRRRLPHWYIIGQPLFVTFRLHGSLPLNRPFPPGDMTSGEEFVAMDRLLDQARLGSNYMKLPDIAELVAASIHHGETLGQCTLHSFCIMPNHVHLLITPRISVSRLLNSLKAVTAKRANLLLGRTGKPFWQDESFDRLVRDDQEFRRIQRYIEINPVRAGLAKTAEEYRWSGIGRPGTPPQPTGLPHKT